MRKWVVIGVIVLLAIGLGAGITWYVITPHTPEAQFAAAETSEKDLRNDALTKSREKLQPKTDETIELYRRVWTRFGLAPKNPKAPEALQRIAKIHEEVEKDNKKALSDLEQLGKENPGEQYEGFALIEEARLIRLEADALKADKKVEAADARYQDAIAKLEEYRKKFEKGKEAIGALMETGRIWQDGIEDPPIHAIDIFTKVIQDYPHSEYEPEAIYRLAKQYERIKEVEKALQLYTQLLEEYPKCKWAADATYARGRLLADEMDQHDEAAKAFEKMAQDFPNDPRAQGAAGDARQERAAAAEDEGKKYGQSRYGGSVPIDTSDDKPLPPAELLKQFKAQKLDAENYDLDVSLEPSEHRITVTGKLKMINRGDEKKDLLLMLGRGLTISSMTVDGAAAETKHNGETLLVSLPAPLARDAETTLGFTYSGQYADASMMQNLQPGPDGGTRGSRKGSPQGSTDQLRGKPAPNISLKGLDGKDLSLADQKGKVVLVDMWATWCPPCRESLPHLQKMADDKKLGDRGLVVWAVDAQERKTDVEAFLKENKYSFTVLLDESGDTLSAYSVSGIPTTLVIGRDGIVKDVFIGYGGAASDKAIEEAVEKALAEPAPGAAAGGQAASAPATTGPGSTALGPSMPATNPVTKPAANLTFDPQMGLGDFGYALSGASWYPITIIGDVFDAHVTLTTPANVEAVCNGAMVTRDKSTVIGTPGKFEFQTRNPVFGIYFAYGPYVMQESQVGDIHFYTYFRPENQGKHRAYVEVANRILSFYASKFAPFPYEKMAIIDTPLPSFLGGVGPASLMFLQQGMVDHPEVPETLLAHELAHQWFGNLIPINITDPGYNQWLSEGFATYCDALYTEYKDGPEAFDLHIQKYQQLYFQLSMLTRPTAIRDTLGPGQPLYRPIVYEKGALVLHMLRKVMGDDKFFQLMRQFVADFRNKPTTTDDFRKLATQINGTDLSWFFAEWYDRAIYAHWKVNAVVSPDGAGSSTKITVTQPDELVVMPVDVTLLSDKGDRVVVKDVMLDKKENVVEARTAFVPVKVIVDEGNWVLKRPGPDNIWPAPAKP